MGERAKGIFSDIHCEEGKCRVTLLHDPTVEGLDTAIYMDGSGSMEDEYGRVRTPSKPQPSGLRKKFWEWLSGIKVTATAEASSGPQQNIVAPQIRRMLQYLATKDRNSRLRVAYWACGEAAPVEVIGELTAADVDRQAFDGPQAFGVTDLLPAIKDFVKYMREQQQAGSRRGCAVIVTDGVIFDVDAVMEYSELIGRQIKSGKLPPLNFVFVGVGAEVDEEQMERICHAEYAGIEHMWCHRIAEEMEDIAQLVAVLVDETMSINSSGRLLDDKGKVLQVYEGRIPAVLEFTVPEGCKKFALEINGELYWQEIPEDEDHH